MLKEPNTPPTGRAGTYRRQTQGYRALIPAPLPPDPPVRIEGHLQSLLSRADLALGRLAGSIETLPKPDLFVLMYVRKEAVLSSQIEGTQSSLKDLLAAEARAFDPRQPRDVAEVLNHVAAMNHGLARLSTLCVPVRMIREIHAKLLEGARGSHLTPNELRTSQNWIGPPGCTLNEATFVPPPPAELPDALAPWNGSSTPRTPCRCWSRSASHTPSSRRSTRSSTATAASAACSSPSCSARSTFWTWESSSSAADCAMAMPILAPGVSPQGWRCP